MTRLSEALERARATPTDVDSGQPTSVLERTGGDELPNAWQFDDAERVTIAPAPAPTPAIPEPLQEPDTFEYRFAQDTADKVVVGRGVDSGLIEQYRRLAAVLHHAQLQRGIRSVMISSAIASEGKTLTATNLALTLSHSYQRRVLLVDADLRRPSLHAMFQVPNQFGLGDALNPATTSESRRLPVHRISSTLWVLTAGRPNADPMSALVSETMKELLAEAMEQFDWVIVDTPPVALMPDAKLLARMIDTALLVVNANSTPYPLVQRAVDTFDASRILGVVLNRADASDLAGEYGHFGYYYSHYAKPRDQRTRFGLSFFRKRKT